MKNNIDNKKQLSQVQTTPALKRLALLISEKAGTCKRNSVATGTGCSISHGYNHALLLAAKHYGLADLCKIDKWYEQYKSKS